MILIYDDKGASAQSVQGWYDFFSKKTAVKCVSGAYLQQPEWIAKTKLLIMPGGRSLPFYEMLDATGNNHIISFIKKGGSYLGVCAGAYYAARNTVFAKNLPHEILSQGALNFFEGDAVGPVFSEEKFAYQSESGACIVNIIFEQKKYPVYFNGGCYFRNNDSTIAHYEENELPAIITFSYEKGRVVLMGVHPELDFNTIPIDKNVHHQMLRKQLVEADVARRELLEIVAQRCYDFP